MFVCLFVLSNVKSKIAYWIAQTFFFVFWENVKTHPILNVVTYLLHLLEVPKQSGVNPIKIFTPQDKFTNAS